ncbi:MAG: hypothetical protein RR893_04080, partial [Clostridia bacterium]
DKGDHADPFGGFAHGRMPPIFDAARPKAAPLTICNLKKAALCDAGEPRPARKWALTNFFHIVIYLARDCQAGKHKARRARDEKRGLPSA